MFIEPRDIEWVESARNYVILHHGGAGGAGRESLVRTTLAEISVKLAPLGFARAHRTALVRLDAVRAIESAGSAAVVLLASGARIPVGRRQRARFAALLPR